MRPLVVHRTHRFSDSEVQSSTCDAPGTLAIQNDSERRHGHEAGRAIPWRQSQSV
jgi:hypothetical protein